MRPADQGGIATVAGADDANSVRVGDTLGDETADPVHQISLHLAAPLPVAGRGEGGAIAL